MSILRKSKSRERLLKQHKKIKSFLISSLVFLLSCNTNSESNNNAISTPILKKGDWRVEMNLNGKTLPFILELKEKEGDLSISIFNGKEEININQVTQKQDSIFFDMPVFESSFFLKIEDSSRMTGNWVNYYQSDHYRIPVSAYYGKSNRFSKESSNKAKIVHRKYEVSFSPNKKEEYKAIGLFETKGNKAWGTFATETGDYRYLEGNIAGDSLYLSTFDGSHAFLFEAKILGDSLKGMFYSGIHFKEDWIALKNNDFELSNPDSLTFYSSNQIDLKLPNYRDSLVDINSDYFNSKVKLIQIMGSWCPNCLDESNYYAELYNKYKDQGLEIIAVAFERTKNKETALSNLKKLKDKTSANYTFLLGGSTKDDNPLDIFPMLSHIMSYPTTIYLNRNNEIVKVHTGFYGPSTAKLFENYKKETEDFIEKLLLEK
jgi:thiol-disulfide isomerase/thioredoxin